MQNEEYISAVNKYADTLYRMSYSICKNKFDAEDAVQNTFLKLYTTKKSFDSDIHLKNWLFKVTVNYCKHLYKSKWKNKTILIDEYKDNINLSYSIDDYGDKADIISGIMSLPAKYRVVVHLYYYEDYSCKEISRLIGEKETTVQTQLSRARQRLRDILGEVWQNEN